MVLLVEDSTADALLTKMALGKTETAPRVEWVKHGGEALERLEALLSEQAALPALILLDLQMPVMDGETFLHRLREHPDLSALPVVVLTTSEDPHEVKRVYGLCANAYLVKPVRAADYADVLGSLDEFWLRTAKLPIS